MHDGPDLAHIGKLIQQHTADAADARRRADTQRVQANQKYQDSDPDGAAYFEQEAVRFDTIASENETEADQLETQKQRLEERLTQLESQRSQIANDHEETLRQLDREIARLRGSGMML